MNYLKVILSSASKYTRPTIKNQIIAAVVIIPGIFFLLTITPYITGCGDDITGTTDYDPPRFNWRIEHPNSFAAYGLYAADTGCIFLLGQNLGKFSKGVLTNYSFGTYIGYKMDGISENEIYIFAGTLNRETVFIKWNGFGFQHYPTSAPTVHYQNSFTGFASAHNEAWICSQKGIIRLRGTNMDHYFYEDTILQPMEMFKNPDGKIQYIGKYENRQALYEFRDTGFVKMYEDSSNVEMFAIGGSVCGLKRNLTQPYVCYYNFDGTSFNEQVCFNSDRNFTFGRKPAGTSFNNLMFMIISYNLFSHSPGYGLAS
jgi:hypothetical protein